MKAVEVEEYARKLREAHGDKAIAEVAQKAREAEEAGRTDEAENWRKVEKALMLQRGPSES